ncbi:MAG: 16S rRNA (guanine(527)-N(7))-methyltransferase RsmG [Aquificae bacterium]|nr:16S rRNA (guanine(527)-N(7))-methyltransferase RsmG [Aquificota bacterium]
MRERIKEIFEREGFPLGEDQARKFETYLRELLKWNRVHNLTAIRDPEEIVKRHFVESVSLVRCFKKAGLNPEGREILDVGTGAGFPGVPLKIYLGNVKLFLVESVGKKCSFLEFLKVKLGEEYEVICERAENLNRKYEIVVARALGEFGEISGLLERLSSGYVFVMKGKKIKKEWTDEKGYRPCLVKLSFSSFYVLYKGIL